MNSFTSFIVRIIPTIDLIKSRKVVSTDEVGTTESTGIPGVNKSYRFELSDGKAYLFKPKSGEHISSWRLVPPKSLYLRERAAYLISKQLGWGFVPEVTIANYDGDIGSLQKWIEPAYHISGDYMEFIEGLDDEQRLKAGLFDLILGNSDRHGKNFMVELEEL